MKIKYDNIADAMYIRYSNNKISHTNEVNDAIIDFDSNGNVVGIEMIGVKQAFQNNNITLQTKTKELEYTN